LQNLIERSVILSMNEVHHIPFAELNLSMQNPQRRARTLAEAQRDHILLDKIRRSGISRPAS
jgi:hypothetical protein